MPGTVRPWKDGSDAVLTPRDWETLLQTALGRTVEVVYSRARSSPVRAHTRPQGGWVVRLHAMFAAAQPPVQAALAAWLRSGRRARKACALLDGWVAAGLARLHREQPLPRTLVSCGRHHDLAAFLRGLLEDEFQGAFAHPPGPPRVTWGRARPRRSRSSLRLGSYDHSARVVRIHPALDREDVPAWFVRYVLFHELLHAVVDEPPRGGRRVLHGPEFRRRENCYPDYRRALRFEARLLASGPRGVDQVGARQAGPEHVPAQRLELGER